MIKNKLLCTLILIIIDTIELDFNFALLSQKLILASDNETGIKLSTELTRVR